MRTWVMIGATLIVSGCWSPDHNSLTEGPTPYSPRADAPPGWIVTEHTSPYMCPDGDFAPVWLVRPADIDDTPQPVAVMYHDGAFDFVIEPEEDDPLAGPTFRTPTRLNTAWAMRRAWTVAGLYAQDDAHADHTGALPAAFAARGVATLIPTNCWGDYWHNSADNADADMFARHGRVLAKWTWRLASEPGFAPDANLDFTPDSSQLYAVGLAEGGRGVAEVLHDPSLKAPAGVILDSVDDDMSVYWKDRDVWGDRLIGMERIWPQGADQAQASRLGTAPLPPRTILLYSNADTQLPAGSIDELALRVQGMPDGKVSATTATRHVQTAGDDGAAMQAVAHVLGDPG
ncbi:MAG: hypothetical protein ACI9MC_002778 [Kiritimatiellia bacterium]|jgi:hypothetical protein